ncbi:hypothetical protein [Hyalangium sp.]|uniref:hypothetical protein n=1 Tax=Hyalangium sp. TaxID=2028555 RepID=UPI002D6E7F50|nr:hypothetical protein [Hyalangium sp.]HYI00473.1 hypothetical protein [Hyalangium sp.]
MWVWLRMVLAMAVVLLPGGFPLVLAYVSTRTLLARWRAAQAQSQLNGRGVSLKDVVAQLHFRDLVREARAAF